MWWECTVSRTPEARDYHCKTGCFPRTKNWPLLCLSSSFLFLPEWPTYRALSLEILCHHRNVEYTPVKAVGLPLWGPVQHGCLKIITPQTQMENETLQHSVRHFFSALVFRARSSRGPPRHCTSTVHFWVVHVRFIVNIFLTAVINEWED